MLVKCLRLELTSPTPKKYTILNSEWNIVDLGFCFIIWVNGFHIRNDKTTKLRVKISSTLLLNLVTSMKLQSRGKQKKKQQNEYFSLRLPHVSDLKILVFNKSSDAFFYWLFLRHHGVRQIYPPVHIINILPLCMLVQCSNLLLAVNYLLDGLDTRLACPTCYYGLNNSRAFNKSW